MAPARRLAINPHTVILVVVVVVVCGPSLSLSLSHSPNLEPQSRSDERIGRRANPLLMS